METLSLVGIEVGTDPEAGLEVETDPEAGLEVETDPEAGLDPCSLMVCSVSVSAGLGISDVDISSWPQSLQLATGAVTLLPRFSTCGVWGVGGRGARPSQDREFCASSWKPELSGQSGDELRAFEFISDATSDGSGLRGVDRIGDMFPSVTLSAPSGVSEMLFQSGSSRVRTGLKGGGGIVGASLTSPRYLPV